LRAFLARDGGPQAHAVAARDGLLASGANATEVNALLVTLEDAAPCPTRLPEPDELVLAAGRDRLASERGDDRDSAVP